MSREDDFLDTPDEPGWYFHKFTQKSSVGAVFVNDDGIAFKLNESGEVEELDDMIGYWEPIEPTIL